MNALRRVGVVWKAQVVHIVGGIGFGRFQSLMYPGMRDVGTGLGMSAETVGASWAAAWSAMRPATLCLGKWKYCGFEVNLS